MAWAGVAGTADNSFVTAISKAPSPDRRDAGGRRDPPPGGLFFCEETVVVLAPKAGAWIDGLARALVIRVARPRLADATHGAQSKVAKPAAGWMLIDVGAVVLLGLALLYSLSFWRKRRSPRRTASGTARRRNCTVSRIRTKLPRSLAVAEVAALYPPIRRSMLDTRSWLC